MSNERSSTFQAPRNFAEAEAILVDVFSTGGGRRLGCTSVCRTRRRSLEVWAPEREPPSTNGNSRTGMTAPIAETSVDTDSTNNRGATDERSVADLSEATLRHKVLQSAPDAIVVIDSRGVIVLGQRSNGEDFGYGRSEVLGKKIEMLLPARYRA